LAPSSPTKELVEYIVRSLVEHPDQVRVTEYQERHVLRLEVHVAESDMGRVIGRKGNIINSMRSLVQVAAAKQGRRVQLEVV
jgi:uncharacterized protein